MGDQLAADYAWQHPDPAAIKAAGYTAVIRYVSADPSKDLTGTEASGLHAQGLGIGLVYETTAQRALGSTVAGLADGVGMSARLTQLGAPAGTPALVNIGDWAVDPSQLGAIAAYYRAFRGQLGAFQPGAGGYGTSWIIDQLAAFWPNDIWWQNAINDAGESGSIVSPNTSIYQRVTPTHPIAGAAGEYDENVWGFGPRAQLDWWASSAPQPAPQPPQGGEMPLPPTIRQGDTGPAVRTAQGLLVARYYRLGTTGPAGDGIDGQFGPLTGAAVREAQGLARITVDGIVGPQTWPHLLGVA